MVLFCQIHNLKVILGEVLTFLHWPKTTATATTAAFFHFVFNSVCYLRLLQAFIRLGRGSTFCSLSVLTFSPSDVPLFSLCKCNRLYFFRTSYKKVLKIKYLLANKLKGSHPCHQHSLGIGDHM